jgi:hypothetical protein
LAQSRAQAGFGHQVYFQIKQSFQVYKEAAKVQQTAIWVQVDQEINITIRAGFAAHDGSKDSYVARTPPSSQGQDVLAAGLKYLLDLGLHGCSPRRLTEWYR